MNRIKCTIVLAVLWNGPTFQHDFWLIIIHHIVFLSSILNCTKTSSNWDKGPHEMQQLWMMILTHDSVLSGISSSWKLEVQEMVMFNVDLYSSSLIHSPIKPYKLSSLTMAVLTLLAFKMLSFLGTPWRTWCTCTSFKSTKIAEAGKFIP